jgi:antitoxin YefM
VAVCRPKFYHSRPIDGADLISVSLTRAFSMQPVMTSITATEARKRLDALVDKVQQSHEPVEISGKRGSAVLVGEQDWRAVQKTLNLVSVPGMRESIMDSMATPVDGLADEIQW